MRKLALAMTSAFAAMTLTTPLAAHPEDEGMFAPRGPSTAELAKQAIDSLVEKKKLPASWSAAKLVSFDFRTKNGVDQYVLIYENSAIKQAAKRKLYVLMSTSGEFLSANHKLV
jgi:hypothetical protein